MGRKKQNKIQNGKMLGCMIDNELNDQIVKHLLETGTSKAEFTRRALKQALVDGQDEAMIMLNLVKHVQAVREMEDIIPNEQYVELMKYSDNIMAIKGGSLNGYI